MLGLGLGVGPVSSGGGVIPDPLLPLYKAMMRDNLDAETADSSGTGTFVRDSQAQYVDSTTGYIATVPANTARFQEDPNTLSQALLIEPEATNLLPKSQSLDMPWASFFEGGRPLYTGFAPNGQSNEATNSYNQYGFGTLYYETSAADNLPDGVAVTFSMYAKNLSVDSAPYVYLGLKHTDGSWTRVYFDLENGTPPVIFPGDDPCLSMWQEWAPGGYTRIGFTAIHQSGSANVNRVSIIQSGDTSSTPYPSVDGDGQSYWGAQLEEGVGGSSIIYTANTSATRKTERAVLPVFPGVVNNSYGAYSATVTPVVDTDLFFEHTDNATGLILHGDNGVTFMMLATDGQSKPSGNFQYNTGNSHSFVSGVYGGDFGVQRRWCMTYNATGSSAYPGTKRFLYIDDAKHARDNNTITDDDFVNYPATTEIYVGYKDQWNDSIPMLISEIKFWSPLSDAQALDISQTGTANLWYDARTWSDTEEL